MTTTRRLSPGAIRALLIAGALAIVGIVLIVVGWTEEHLWQSVLLQLSWLVFDAAVFVVLWHLISSRQLLPPRTERFRACWLMMLAGCTLGLLLYLVALLTRHAMLTPLGQLFIAMGLGAMACYLAATLLGDGRHTTVEQVPELADMMDDDDDVDAPLTALVAPRRAFDD